jgi:putative NADPH-quinone reductase
MRSASTVAGTRLHAVVEGNAVNITLILAHPLRASLTGALADAVRDTLAGLGHAVQFHHLDAEHFDPRIPAAELTARRSDDPLVEQHCAELAGADGIVIVHPNWWSQPPANLKGWLDRVVRPGVAYDFAKDDAGRSVPVGLLRARAAIVLNTANVPQEQERALLGDPLETLWRKCVFDRCGVKSVHRKVYAIAAAANESQRAAWLEEARDLARTTFPAGA